MRCAWPLHTNTRVEWPMVQLGRKFKYWVFDAQRSPFRNLMYKKRPQCHLFVLGYVVGRDGHVHGRRMNSGLYPKQPWETHMGVHCGQVTGLRPGDFRYDLRLTCEQCIRAVDLIICNRIYSDPESLAPGPQAGRAPAADLVEGDVGTPTPLHDHAHHASQ